MRIRRRVVAPSALSVATRPRRDHAAQLDEGRQLLPRAPGTCGHAVSRRHGRAGDQGRAAAGRARATRGQRGHGRPARPLHHRIPEQASPCGRLEIAGGRRGRASPHRPRPTSSSRISATACMDRLGLGYEAIKARKPDIIYASGTGWGSKGPDARARGAGPHHPGPHWNDERNGA